MLTQNGNGYRGSTGSMAVSAIDSATTGFSLIGSASPSTSIGAPGSAVGTMASTGFVICGAAINWGLRLKRGPGLVVVLWFPSSMPGFFPAEVSRVGLGPKSSSNLFALVSNFLVRFTKPFVAGLIRILGLLRLNSPWLILFG
ncbi:uncharacterized protein LOC141525895 isoform X2 [Cotesia typhae]|uniref:uncharacterized protein LOC141525895 isoform X2 n=1 Tax=Cotesia typhae TaxID=2053667 RepID=UPI003D697EAD